MTEPGAPAFFPAPKVGRVPRCDPPAVEMRGIVKLYPDGTLALRGVDFTACQGEVHALLGENGAGKTTLMRILYGEIRPTRGEVRVFGERVAFSSPRDALRKGIAMVYQHFSLVPGLTVLENIALAFAAVRGRVGMAEVRAAVEAVMERTGLRVPLDEDVDALPVGVKQRVELVKALALGARVLVLDEPTSVLTPLEARQLFKTLRALRDAGVTVILITHKLREVMEVADRVTVLRRGKVVGTARVGEVDERALARMMVGEEVLTALRPRRSRGPGRPLLVVRDLWVRGPHGGWAVRGVSLEVREREILGIAGVQGNGQRELAEAIAGVRPAERGSVVLDGVDVTGLPPSERYRLGLAYVADDRSVGLVLEESVTFNSVLTSLRRFVRRLGLLDWASARGFAARVVREFGVATPSLSTPVKYLSGGNQQRLMIGRDVARSPRVLVVAEPTHGLDVAATRYVRELLLELRDQGCAILLISSDLEEVMQLSDRVAVMHGGRILSVRRPEEYTVEELGMLMGGVEVARPRGPR